MTASDADRNIVAVADLAMKSNAGDVSEREIEAVETLTDMQPQTLAGLAAKARVAIELPYHEDLRDSILADIVRIAHLNNGI